MAALFPKDLNGIQSKERFKASDLYIPSEELKQLKMPIIDWKSKWHKNTEEAKFLNEIGIKSIIPINELIVFISINGEEERNLGLKYFINHFTDEYSKTYNSRNVSKPFIPCKIKDGSNCMSLPTECYSDSGCQIMGFRVSRVDLKEHSEKFQIDHHPSSFVLIKVLETTKFEIEDSKLVFEYLSSRMSCNVY